MHYPYLNDIPTSREMTTVFAGYNHTSKCTDGEFYDMRNVNTENFPILSRRKPRKKYGFRPVAVDRESFTFVTSSGNLYVDGHKVCKGAEGTTMIVRMGGIVALFPSKKWVNIDEEDKLNDMEAQVYYKGNVTFSQCDSEGNVITSRNPSYYDTHTAADGDYMTETKNGVSTLKTYSAATGMWATVSASPYIRIMAESGDFPFGKLNNGDGVIIGVADDIETKAPELVNIFVNEEGMYDESGQLDNIGRTTNAVIKKKNTGRYIFMPGILKLTSAGDSSVTYSRFEIAAQRNVPDMAYVVECQNRLWGCSDDGREIFACKLGDVTNWNVYSGISTDSFTATIGSQGEFTGAITYQGQPMFFKETSVTKVTVSPQGAHQTRDIPLRGVAKDSPYSLIQIDELLYYKSTNGVCVYDGNYPVDISEPLGAVTYRQACGGTVNGKYYISMRDLSGTWHLFVYDTKKKLWSKEDDLEVNYFLPCPRFEVDFERELPNGSLQGVWQENINELYACTSNGLVMIKGLGKTLYLSTDQNPSDEEPYTWMIESGALGFELPDKKQLSRISVRMRLEADSVVTFRIQYDSVGEFERVWQIYGRGTKTFTIPMKPRRCDHYRFRIEGRGDGDIISITKSYSEGSDM